MSIKLRATGSSWSIKLRATGCYRGYFNRKESSSSSKYRWREIQQEVRRSCKEFQAAEPPHWALLLSQAPIWGNGAMGGRILSRTCFAGLGHFVACPRCVLFLPFLGSGQELGLPCFTRLGRASAKGLEHRFLLAPVSPDWSLFIQIGAVEPNHTCRRLGFLLGSQFLCFIPLLQNIHDGFACTGGCTQH